ncbi:MAG: hypothetical protein AAF108_07935 [Planctomycetota bacterium]
MIRRGAIVLIACVCVLAAVLGACSEHRVEAAEPEDAGPRIAVLSPALALTLRELGLEDRIVARHAWDSLTPASVPAAGDQAAIDYETLLDVRPTHVLVEWGQRDLPDKLVELAEARAWRLSDHRTLTLDDIARTTRELAEQFGVTTVLPQRLEDAWAPRPSVDAGPVLLLIQTTPEIAALGPGSAHHQILTRLGHTPALEDGSPYQVLLAEDVLELDPAHIVLIRPGSPPEEVRLGPIGALGLRARVHTLTDPADLVSGPNLLGFTDRLSAALAAE